MNSYSSVFSTQDLQNNRNQFESQVTTKQPETKLSPVTQFDTELVLKFLEVVSKDPANVEKSSEDKLKIAIEMVRQLKTF